MWHWIGLAVQLVGAAVTLWGFGVTWREWRPEGVGVLDPVLIPAAAAWRRVRSLVTSAARRLLRRPQTVNVGAGFSEGVGASIRARARIQFRSLPTSDVTAALEELDLRSRRLMDLVSDTGERLEDELERVRTARDELENRSDTAIARLEAQDRRVAVGGVRWEAAGLLLVVIGQLLQSAG